ncbi:MAG: hypothetical protein ACPG5O_10050 [Pseudoalteromonas tetraodonis]
MSKTIPGGLYRDANGNYKDASGNPIAKKDAEAAIKDLAKGEGLTDEEAPKDKK